MNTSFILTKWYLDCVTDVGDAAILYSAELKWHKICARYNSVLLRDRFGISTHTKMRGCSLPTLQGETVFANIDSLALSGIWSADAAPVSKTVYANEFGAVEWNCVQPRSRVELSVGQRSLHGLGYAECLTLTLPPWKLPMRELRWGRFVSDADSIVWIDWKGSHSTSIAVHNGATLLPNAISDTRVELPDVELKLTESITLRGGELGKTILPAAPALAKLLPKSLFGIQEHKWLSRGACAAQDHTSSGWVIHEVVHWNL